MVSAKDIIIKPITKTAAAKVVKQIHYSGKIVNNSTLHFGAFLNGKLEGAMSFGPPLDKRKVLPLVKGTGWNEMLELNRMAFSDRLPRNSESRCLAIAFKLIKKHYPHVAWILSFSDGTQCGDGTIYRASGFVLTGIKKNTALLKMPDGKIVTDIALNTVGDGRNARYWKRKGAKPLNGYQLRYIYFLHKDKQSNLSVPILPFSTIDEMGAGMYRGEKRTRAKQAMAEHHSAQRGSVTHQPAPSIKKDGSAEDA